MCECPLAGIPFAPATLAALALAANMYADPVGGPMQPSFGTCTLAGRSADWLVELSSPDGRCVDGMALDICADLDGVAAVISCTLWVTAHLQRHEPLFVLWSVTTKLLHMPSSLL